MLSFHFSYLLILTLTINDYTSSAKSQEFEVAFYWNSVNFTWPSSQLYQNALDSGRYIPPHSFIAGIKLYQDNIYLTTPRIYNGTPVTLAYLPVNSSNANPLLKPYPNWETNVGESCETLQNVYSMEIDTKGIMWVLDGMRVFNQTNCPPKIVLLDLNNNGKLLQSYIAPTEICASGTGWMNDIVVDESEGGYAYITDASNIDPGIIIFSRAQNRAWKVRDSTMFANIEDAGFYVKGIQINSLLNVDGIALDPKANSSDRLLYYTPVTGCNLYAISTNVLLNETLLASSDWRKQVQWIGRRSSPTDGMMMDNKGNLYYGLLTEDAIGKWSSRQKHRNKQSKIVYKHHSTIDWPDGFGMDNYGNLYVTMTGAERILNTTYHPPPKDGIRYRILKAYVGTKSYLYS